MSARPLLLALVLLLAAPASAETIAITGGRVLTGADSAPLDGATVVVSNGRITAVGRGVAVPMGARVIDASGKWVTPGIIGGFTRLGLLEVDAVDSSNDAEADTSPFSAAIDVAPAINPHSVNIAINRIDGVTRAAVGPAAGKTIFGGQGAIIHLGDASDSVMRPRAFQFVELGERGAGIAGGSRAAAFTQFKNGLAEALAYARGRRRDGASRDAILNEADAAALVPVVQGRQPLMVHVERASDILRVIELRRDYPALRLIIVGAGEGWMVADRLAAARVPVIVNALSNLPDAFETLAATQSNAGRMVAAGVTVALGLLDNDDGRQVRLLPQHAGNLVALGKLPGATGVSHAQAMAMLTRAPAEIFGLADLGTLASGKRADVVVWDGDPLELASAPSLVLIDGKPVSMQSRQTRLRDRYRPGQQRTLPAQYTR